MQRDYFSSFNPSDHLRGFPSSMLKPPIIVEVGGMIDEHYDRPSTNSEQYYYC